MPVVTKCRVNEPWAVKNLNLFGPRQQDGALRGDRLRINQIGRDQLGKPGVHQYYVAGPGPEGYA
jgi:hypothetical protein